MIIFLIYIDIVKELENEIDNFDEGYEKFVIVILNNGKEWYRSIDIVINKMKSEIIEMKKKYREVLEEYLLKIK